MERRWGASALPSTFSGPPSGKREAASVRLKPVSRRPQYYDDVSARGAWMRAAGHRSPMLQLSLRPGEYLTIHGDIVVQLAQLSGSRAFLRVEADRSIPIVRGKVLERSGAPRPECLASLPRSRARKGRDAVYHWSAERERAVRTMEQLLERMEAGDSREEAQALRAQLEHLLPTVWEEELSGQIQALFRSKTAQDV